MAPVPSKITDVRSPLRYDPHASALTWRERLSIAVVIPTFRAEQTIDAVIRTIPAFIRHIIVVDDCSPDRSAELVAGLASEDSRIVLLRHEVNKGVGGAMVTGYRQALELGAQIVVKMDSDGQMSPDDLPALIAPLVRGEADYTKGNRFRDFRALQRMPLIRRAGNMGLSFLSKASTGYWNRFDPNNGYVAIRGEILAQLPLDRIHHSYFFETSMLSQLYLMGAHVQDVTMPARYGTETSSMALRRIVLEFPVRLVACLWRRLVLKNFIYDFSMESVYLLSGIPMVLLGVLYGGYHWVRYAEQGISAPTGTVVIPAMLIILGFQLLLAAVALDIQAVPREPICGGALLDPEYA